MENINQELQQQTRTLAETFGGPYNPKPTNPQCASSMETYDAPDSQSPLYQKSESKVALDVRSTASQTIETSFVPCDACYQVQLSFRDVGDMVVEVCKAQNLPSAVMKHRQTVSEEVMTAADISRWRKEGEKDLNRIRAHLSNLLAQINPLKSSLDDSKQTCEKLSKNLSDKYEKSKFMFAIKLFGFSSNYHLHLGAIHFLIFHECKYMLPSRTLLPPSRAYLEK